MKKETIYLQTHTMACEILNHAHTFCMVKRLTTKNFFTHTSLPFAYNLYRYLIVHFQSFYFICPVTVRSVTTRICLEVRKSVLKSCELLIGQSMSMCVKFNKNNHDQPPIDNMRQHVNTVRYMYIYVAKSIVICLYANKLFVLYCIVLIKKQ